MNNDDLRRQILSDFIDSLSMNVSTFARAIGYSQSHLSETLNGSKSFGERKAETIREKAELAGFFGLDFANNKSGHEASRINEDKNMVVWNMYTATGGCADDETHVPDTIDHDTKVGLMQADRAWARHRLAADVTSLDNIALVTAKGNSMEPLYSSGDVLFVDTGYTVLDHQNVYMFRYDGQIMIKTLQPRGRDVWVYAENKELASSAPWQIDSTRDFAILGKVAGKSGMNAF